MFSLRTLFSGLLIAAVVASAGCDVTQRYTEQQHMQRASEFQAQGKLESAIIELKNAVQKNPKNAEARQRLGEIYIAQGLGEAAEGELKRAQDLGIDYELLKVPMGQALLLQGEYARILREVRTAPTSPPENVPKILEIQGRAQLGANHFEEGCQLFAQAQDDDPKYIPSYWGLTRCAVARGKVEEAHKELDKAIELDGKNSGTWSLLGDLERATKRVPEAETAYANALKYDSKNVDALLGRALVRIESNQLEEANRDIDAAQVVARNSPLANQLRGVVQFRQAKFDAAQASFQTVLKAQPNYLPAVLWLGLTNYVQKNYEQAAVQFAQYARNVPSIRVQALLGLTQAKLGRGAAASKTLDVLRGVEVTDPQSLAALAQANLYLGDTDLAAAYLTKAIEQKPDAAALRVDLAAILSEKGARAQANELLESAIRLDPGITNADVLLVQNLIRDNQFEKALQVVASLEKTQPSNPDTYNLKGAIYVAKNDLANARSAFEQALVLDPLSVTTAVNLARLDLRDNKPEVARQRFEAVLAKNQNNVQAMMALAAFAAATGQESEFINWMQKAAQAAPSDPRPRVFLAKYYLQKNDIQKALAIAREAQAASPNNADALEVLGTAQLVAGEKENAGVTYGKLVTVVPKNPVAYYELATAQVTARAIDAARLSLNKALELKPRYLDAEVLLAAVELAAGRYKEAAGFAQQIQQQQPESSSGFVLEGEILMTQKQFAAAAKAYEKALAIDNSGPLAVKVHQALRAGGHTEDADAWLIHWLGDHPRDVTARIHLAATYINSGQNKQAIEQYELVLAIDPKNVIALNDLAWLYQRQNDPRALGMAEQAYQLNSESPAIMDTLGWTMVEQGKITTGMELLRKATEKAPADTTIRYHWAAALAKSGDTQRARKELADLLTNNKTFPERQDAQTLLRQLGA
jgi:putative PEP-CTERM system TPR-repeat lipoprotein